MFNYINILIYNIYKLVKKIEKKFRITLFFIFPSRIFHVSIERLFLDKIPSKNFCNISNYFLKKINKKSLTVISAGIGTDASFEATMIKKFNIKKLIAIDPTPIGKKTIKKIKSKKIYFENKALYIHNKKIEAFVPFEEDNTNVNVSIDNLYNTSKYILLKSINLKKLLKIYNIKIIDILKLDIEGVADKVIEDCIKNTCLPKQITFEIERPYSILKQIDFFKRFINLIILLKSSYKVYYTGTEKLGFRSEILAVLK